MSNVIDELVRQVKDLKVVELVELTKKIKEEFDLGDMMMSAPVAAVTPADSAESSEAAKSEFAVFFVGLSDAGSKMPVIKLLKAEFGLGLKEAKAICDDGKECELKSSVPKAEAESLKKKLEEAGAKIILK